MDWLQLVAEAIVLYRSVCSAQSSSRMMCAIARRPLNRRKNERNVAYSRAKSKPKRYMQWHSQPS